MNSIKVHASDCGKISGCGLSKIKKALSIDKALDQVPETGFEPAHPFGRYHLKVVRLPISPPGQLRTANVSGLLFQYNSECGSFSGFGIFYKNFSFVVLLNDSFR